MTFVKCYNILQLEGARAKFIEGWNSWGSPWALCMMRKSLESDSWSTVRCFLVLCSAMFSWWIIVLVICLESCLGECYCTDELRMENPARRREVSLSDESWPWICVLSFYARPVIMRDGNVHKVQSIKLSVPFKPSKARSSGWSTMTIEMHGRRVTPLTTKPLKEAFINSLNVRKIKRWKWFDGMRCFFASDIC